MANLRVLPVPENYSRVLFGREFIGRNHRTEAAGMSIPVQHPLHAIR